MEISATPVFAANVSVGFLDISSVYPGELQADVSDLSSRISGRLKEVLVRIGDRVNAGDIIAIIDDADLQRQYEEYRAQVAVEEANLLEIKARLSEAEQERSRMETLLEDGLVSTQDTESVRATEEALQAQYQAIQARKLQSQARVELLSQQLEETRVLAPFAGIVSERYLNPGEFVQPGTPIVRLVESGPLRVLFWVPEEELDYVRSDTRFFASTPGTGNTFFNGRVTGLAGEMDRSNRTLAVEGVLLESHQALRAGMYSTVQVTRGRVQGKIVPGAAVLHRVNADGKETDGVFVVDQQAARWIPVTILGRDSDYVAIEGAVEEGQQVLTFGHQNLADGARVSIVESTSPLTQWNAE
ncbi:MAG TPA: efflux RND transporter periplasmic adaptor subunit [Acidobacteriota bacterium]|nr:efflux RND transporter periplasmic adaptor subunit [Acidobacteriota bacterium]